MSQSILISQLICNFANWLAQMAKGVGTISEDCNAPVFVCVPWKAVSVILAVVSARALTAKACDKVTFS